MRWIYFLIVVLACVVVQTTVAHILWFRTSLGWIGPVFPAALAVFVALYARSGTDAALAGWAVGFALDLALSGGGLGLSAVLYAAAAAAVYRVREAFFRDRPLTQMVLVFAFCLFVHELWAAYHVVVVAPGGAGYWRPAVQAVAVSAYTAALAPLVCAPLKRIRRLLIAPSSGRDRI